MPSRSRHRFLRCAVAAGTVGIAGCRGPGSDGRLCTEGRIHEFDAPLDEHASWPMPHHDAANTGWNPTGGGPREEVGVAWRYRVCGVGGIALVHGGSVYVGTSEHDGRTGERLASDRSIVGVAVEDGVLFVADDGLAANDLATGQRRWSIGTARSPRVAAGTIYYTYNPVSLRARDVAAGTERWRTTVDERVETEIAVGDGLVVAVSERDQVYAFDAEDGTERWRARLDADIRHCPPVVRDGTIYLGSWDENGEVVALQAADGSLVWRQVVGHRIRGPVAVTDDAVYAAGRQGAISALDAADGSERWQRRTNAHELAAPAVAGRTVYTGATPPIGSGYVYAFDVEDGTERWRYQTREIDLGDHSKAGITTSPAVVDGVAYVTTIAGDRYAFAERP